MWVTKIQYKKVSHSRRNNMTSKTVKIELSSLTYWRYVFTRSRMQNTVTHLFGSWSPLKSALQSRHLAHVHCDHCFLHLFLVQGNSPLSRVNHSPLGLCRNTGFYTDFLLKVTSHRSPEYLYVLISRVGTNSVIIHGVDGRTMDFLSRHYCVANPIHLYTERSLGAFPCD
jgi:hypothetical protein